MIIYLFFYALIPFAAGAMGAAFGVYILFLIYEDLDADLNKYDSHMSDE